MMRTTKISALVLGVCFGLGAGMLSAAEPDWSTWRGPTSDGHSQDANLPVEWSVDDIEWKTELKGEGQSTPCVWGEKIFLTRSDKNGTERYVFCLNRGDGKILWEKKVDWNGKPEPTHRMNGWASASCATDGELVFAFFGKAGLHCYTVNGNPVWSKDLGDFPGPFGTAASPMLYKNLLIQNCDAESNAAIIAFEKKTGKQVWKTKRVAQKGGWSTPILIHVDDKLELVLNGETGVDAYNPDTGELLWHCNSFNGRGSPTVTPGKNGLLHVVNGKPGDVYAIKPGGQGDVTATHRVWHTSRKVGRDLPSPIVVNGQMLVSSAQGVICSYDTDKGTELWKGRLGGNFSAAPIAYKGLAFFVREDNGETVVIKPGAKLEIAARNELGVEPNREEVFRSGITPDDGQLLIRSTKMLYCIGKRTSTK